MTRTDAESIIERMNVEQDYLFKYIQEFIPVHYVLLKKNESGEIRQIESRSTTVIKDLTRDLVIKMMIDGSLQDMVDKPWETDAKHLRTGGCTCGAWITSIPTYHSSWCNRS